MTSLECTVYAVITPEMAFLSGKGIASSIIGKGVSVYEVAQD